MSRYFKDSIRFGYSLYSGGMAIVFGFICKEFKDSITANGNKIGSVPVGHVVKLTKCYEDMKFFLESLLYS